MIKGKIALSMILQRCSWKLSPSHVHSPMTVFTLAPAWRSDHFAQAQIKNMQTTTYFICHL